MKIEITETKGYILWSEDTCYRYDCFIDNELVAGAECYNKQQEPYEIYKHFIKKLIRNWNDQYKKILNNKNAPIRDNLDFINPKTIVKEEIQDIDLTLKRAHQFIREQRLQEDFNDNNKE